MGTFSSTMNFATIAVFALLAVVTQALLDGERGDLGATRIVSKDDLCKGVEMTGIGNKPEKDNPGFGGCEVAGAIKIFPRDLIDKFDKDPKVQLDFASVSCGQALFGGTPGTPALTVAPKLVQHDITPKTKKTKVEVVKQDGSKTYYDPPRGFAACYEHRFDVKEAHKAEGAHSSLCTVFVPKGKYPGLACHHLMVQKHRPEGFDPHKHRDANNHEMRANACQCDWGLTIVEFEKPATGINPVPLRQLHCGFAGLHESQTFAVLEHPAGVPWGNGQKKKMHQLYCQNWHRLKQSSQHGDTLQQLD